MRHIFGTQSIYFTCQLHYFPANHQISPTSSLSWQVLPKNLPSDIFPVSHTFSATCHILPATSPSLAKHRFFFVTSDIPPQLLPRLPLVIVFLLGLLPLLPFAIFSCQFPYFPATFHIPLNLTLFLSIALSSYSFATFRYTSYLESI